MNLVDLEQEALKLPVGERAHLAEILLESLDTLSEEEHRRLWAEEAARRDAALDADPSAGRPADEVFRDARARLRWMLRATFHDRAEEELNEAAGYYARARPGLGDAFLAEVHHAVESLLAAPLAGAAVEREKYDELVKYIASIPDAPRRRDDGRMLAETATRALAGLKGCVATAAQHRDALLFRLVPPPG